MKKFVKSILALTLVLAISFAFAGCKIVIIEGKWTATEMTVEQYIYADDTQEKTIVETKANMINAGAQFVATSPISALRLQETGRYLRRFLMRARAT